MKFNNFSPLWSGKVFTFSFFFILRSPAILRSRILRHKASALRLGQFSNFWEKLLKNLYSLMVTDMRRCILASVGSAVLALSTCVTVLKEEKEEASSALCFLFIFSWLSKLLIHMLPAVTAQHCTALCNTKTLRLSRWRRRVVHLPLARTRLVTTRLVHCVCVHRARRL